MTSFISDSSSSNSQTPLDKWRYLTLAVSANPPHLPTHTQRIMLALNIHLQPYLSGALQDFFITLKTTGRPLKEKMFNLVSPLLDISNRTYFRQWLEDGTDQHLECRHYPGSVLKSNHCQTSENDNDDNDMAVLGQFLDKNYQSIVDKSQYCIAYGYIEKGQTLLETEILKKKRRQSHIEQALLSIYYHSQNKNALQHMTQNLVKMNRTLSEDWKKIQSIAKEW